MELNEAEAEEEELRDAKDVDLLVDLGGRFLRSALHLGAGEFQPLEMQRMEFVLEGTNVPQFINHCMQEPVLEALQVSATDVLCCRCDCLLFREDLIA